jgi:hypothetical protein
MGMMGKDMGNMMSKWKEQEAELDKLVADMNSAPSDKKVDAIAVVVTKLVEQRKAMHEGMRKMMTEGGRYDENGPYDADDGQNHGQQPRKPVRERTLTTSLSRDAISFVNSGRCWCQSYEQ